MFVKRHSRLTSLQVVIGLVIGVIYGVGVPGLAVQMKSLDNGLIKLIKIPIAPIILCMVVSGISGVDDLKKVGRIGLKLVIYLEVLTTITLILGLVAACSLGLGGNVNIHLNELPAGDVTLYTGHIQEVRSPVAFLMGLIPASVFNAFTEDDVLQVLLFSVLFGSVLDLVGEQVNDVACLIDGFSYIVSHITGMIMRLIPPGVFGTVVFTTARYGVDSLSHLGAPVLVFYATCLVFVMTVFSNVLCLSGVCMLPFLRYFHGELMTVMGTAPSDVVLPQVVRKLEHIGIRSSTIGLVIPIGYSFSLDRFSVYLTLTVVFIAHATGTSLAMTDPVTILLVSLMISKGAHGILDSALVILIVIPTAVSAIPMAGLVPVLSVDRFMGTGRALTNLIGSCMITVTIIRQENDIDMPHVQAILDGRLEAPTEADGEPLKHSAMTRESKLHSWRTETRCTSDWQVKRGDVSSSSKLVSAVAQRLLDAIEQGRWVADQTLPDQCELAEQMEISQPNLHEAITVLGTLSVARSLPGKGAMVLEHSGSLHEVAAPGEVTMEDILQLRRTLGPSIVGIVVQSAGVAETSELRLLLLDLCEAAEGGDPQALAETYMAFYQRLTKLTSNPTFPSVFEQIDSALECSDNLVHHQPEYAEKILQEHNIILHAICQYDNERASQAMRQHILDEGACLNIDLCLPQVRSSTPGFQPGTIATPG